MKDTAGHFVPLTAQIGSALTAAHEAEAAGVTLKAIEFNAIAASLQFLADNRDWIIPAWRERIDRDRASVATHPAVAALLDGLPKARIAHVRPLSGEDDFSDITDTDATA